MDPPIFWRAQMLPNRLRKLNPSTLSEARESHLLHHTPDLRCWDGQAMVS